jgi:basic amino acid/polyamine antiporter, APA family
MNETIEQNEMKRELGLLDATLLVAGSMIGSGIFIVAADITRNVGSGGWLIAVWLITGLMTLIAALSYGELSAMFPKAGGQYVYLKEAYNPLVGFLYVYCLFMAASERRSYTFFYGIFQNICCTSFSHRYHYFVNLY